MRTKVILPAPKVRLAFHPRLNMADRPIIRSSADGVALIRQYWDESCYDVREEAWLVLLAASGRVLGCFQLSIGGVSNTVIDPAIVFLIALRTPGVKSLMLAHNHPSGSTKPSSGDLLLTKKVSAAAELFNLKLVDHFILTKDSYLSMSDEGLL